MSPFLAALVGGVLGGVSCGVVIVALLALFGRRVAQSFFNDQVAYLEKRFKEGVLDALLGRVVAFLDQSERIGQIAKRVVEIVQLIVRGRLPEPAPAGAPPLGAAGLAQSHATLAVALRALGRVDEARRELEEALRLDPAQPTARQELAALSAAPAGPLSPAGQP